MAPEQAPLPHHAMQPGGRWLTLGDWFIGTSFITPTYSSPLVKSQRGLTASNTLHHTWKWIKTSVHILSYFFSHLVKSCYTLPEALVCISFYFREYFTLFLGDRLFIVEMLLKVSALCNEAVHTFPITGLSSLG